jgi:hypothetical protein
VVAALKFYLRIYRREDLSSHPLVSLFGKGAQNLAPLPKEENFIWNPETAMQMLRSKTIPCSFLKCAKEALLLLLLATGWRCVEAFQLF